jgi:hypothetical protein
MKNRKPLCAAAILSLALTIPAFAGDIQTPTVVAPPPPPEKTEAVSDLGDTSAPSFRKESNELSSQDLWVNMIVGLFSSY